MDTLFETDNYKVVVGTSPWTEVDDACYLIINKTTNVTEAEHRVLAYANSWCKQFEELIKDFNEKQKTGEVGVDIPAPPIEKL